MIDIHCHILPYIDDGPSNFQDCLDMASRAVSSGITHVFATPHHLNGRYENPKIEVLRDVNNFNKLLSQLDIPLVVHLGQELRIHPELVNSLENDEILTLDNRGKYLLLELPSGEVPSYAQELVYELLLKGITPIIAHPERNLGIIEDSNLLFELVQEGALTQLTSGSIIGHFGKKIKHFSNKIIDHHLAHFVASDAHNNGSRRFTLQEAYEAITKTYGIGYTMYFKENAELLIKGQSLSISQPLQMKKRILGIF
ncbi:tyrosine-protein phosphatase [Peribacillus glennii]|uniref:Tyrosine-protein phosphatase n=1 Tax=Peribacillus glennii TaxID=2303991 RepID=A0A372LEK7_9BACI|nr:CpsB/CapC family capsule biosynthesis tyrosine phosphatase [Peribacillus glennii]RFU64751.1 tyrosine protein phosphatase [Peribacillus glennii]